MLWRRKGVVAASVVLLGAVAALLSFLQTPLYEAEVQVLLRPPSSEALLSATGGYQQDPARKVETEIEVARSDAVRSEVESRLGPVPPAEVTGVGSSDIMEIRARSESPRRAADIATAYADAYIEHQRISAVNDLRDAETKIQAKIVDIQRQIDALEPRTSSGGNTTVRDQLLSQQALFRQRLDDLRVDAELQTGGAQLVTRSAPPITKVRPTPVRYGVMAVSLGLLAGVGMAFFLDSMDDSVKTKDDLTRVVPGLPVLGLISSVEGWKDGARPILVSVQAPNSAPAESYRSLRTSIQFVGIQRAPRIIQVTSAHAGEGKTATVSNLGVALARSGQRTVLVDCDLRRGRLHTFFDLKNDVGFTSLYLDEETVATAATPIADVKNLSVVPCGPIPPNPSEILSDKRTGEVLATLLETCDVVLVDCPPVLPVSDPAALSVWVEATILVVSSGVTRKQDVQRAVEILLQGDAPLVGTVLNNVRPQDEYAYASSYYHDARDGAAGSRRLRTLRKDAAAG